jgi:hypothetical protein
VESRWSQWSHVKHEPLGSQSLGLRFDRCSLSPSPSAPKGWLRRLGFSSDPPPPGDKSSGVASSVRRWVTWVSGCCCGFLFPMGLGGEMLL